MRERRTSRSRRRPSSGGKPPAKPAGAKTNAIVEPANLGAREIAWVAIEEYRGSGTFIAEALARLTNARPVSPPDRRLAMELALGVIRRQATLDALLARSVSRPRQNVEGGLWTLLQLGVYQLAFTDGIPAYAAINETVDAARSLGQPGWTAFLNGVLRNVSRQLRDEFTDLPAADALPLSPGRYRRLNEPVFPDPAADAAAWFAQAHSFPRWLADRWLHRNNFAELCRLGFWFNAPPRLTLRVNALRTTRDALLAALRQAGIEAEPGAHSAAIVLEGPARIDELPGYAEGWFAVQDESAMRAGELLAPAPGSLVLDLCAAPGTKTTHLAELMHNQGKIIACDVDPKRLAQIDENRRRLGAAIIETRQIADGGANIPAGPFDAILLDVPCSNTGVLARRPEVRWRLQPRDIDELARLQGRLLGDAIRRLKPGGRLVYSTCSIEPEENGALVRGVLSAAEMGGKVTLAEEIEHVPGRPADGGYQALLLGSG